MKTKHNRAAKNPNIRMERLTLFITNSPCSSFATSPYPVIAPAQGNGSRKMTSTEAELVARGQCRRHRWVYLPVW